MRAHPFPRYIGHDQSLGGKNVLYLVVKPLRSCTLFSKEPLLKSLGQQSALG